MTIHRKNPLVATTLVALVLGLAAACTTALDVGVADRKIAAQQAGGVDPSTGDDLCESNGWYGDDECDTFCPTRDPDCSVSNNCEPVVCDRDLDCQNGYAKNADGCEICQCAPPPGPICPTVSACTIDCQFGLARDADGCEICECAPASGGPGPILDACPSTPSDDFELNTATLAGDVLTLNVSYGGGCEQHVFSFCWDGSFLESNPVQARIGIHHEGNDDNCDAYLTEDVTLDLTQLKTAYQEGYRTTTGTILLSVGDTGVTYSF